MGTVVKKHIPDPMGWQDAMPVDLCLRVLGMCDELSFEQGETIYLADDPSGGIYAALSGRLDLHWSHFPPHHTLWHAVGPGWWIGDMGAFSGQQRRTDVIAGRPSKVLRLSLANIKRLMREEPTISLSFLAMSTATTRAALNIIEHQAILHPTCRIASSLLSLNFTGASWDGRLPITQGELAQISRISRRRVISALHELEGERLIELGYGSISILDSKRLQTSWIDKQ